MHSTCRNPSLSLGYRAPPSLSFIDYYSSCFLDDRLGRNPISLSPPPSCCCCCFNSIYRLPINPSLLYGLRQSTLIQWSPSRRLILNVRNQCFSRFSVSDLDGKYASFKESGGGGRKVRGRWGKGRYGCMIYEERGKGDYSGDVGDEVEMMLSLLTEEVGEECFGVRERNGTSWRLQVENQKRENSDGISCKSRKKNVGLVGLESTSKRDQEYNVARYRERIRRQKEDRREEERENISRCENCRVRIEGSSSKSDQSYDIAQYKTRKDDRREEGMENISRSENRRVRKEGSTWKSDQEYDTARYREEITRHKEDGREEEKDHKLTSDNQKVRKEGSTLRIDQEYDTPRYREEIERKKEDRREGERENLSRSENRRLRKEGSSCSSYYSVSSAGEFESDTELQVKDDRIVGQSSSEYRREQRRNEDVRYDAEVKEKVERHGDYVKEHEILMKKENNTERFYGESTGVERDWRKKSEKKLNEVIIEQTESKKKLAEECMRLSKIEHTGYERSSDFKQQYNDRKEKSTLAVNINEGTAQHHSLNDDRISGQSESRIKYKQFSGMPELHSTVVEATSSSQKRYSGVEKYESTSVSLVQETKGAHWETAGRVARQDAYRRESQQIAEVSEIDKRGDSSSLSETRMKNLEDNSTTVIGMVSDREEKHQKTGQFVTKQTGSRIKSHQMTEISESEELDTESTSLSRTKADIGMKKQEEKSEVHVKAKFTDTHRVSEESTSRQERYLTSVVEDKVTDTRRVSQNSTDRQERYSTSVVEGKVTDTQRVSQKSTNQQERYLTSVVEGKVTDTQRDSEKKTNRQESSSTSVVESIDKTKERHSLIDKDVLQIEPRKGTRRPVKASSFNEGMPKEASSTYKSLKLIPESIVQKIGDDDDDKRSSQPIVIPPLHIESTSEFSSESFRSRLSELPVQREESSPAPGSDIYGGNRRGESGGEPLDFISHEDALGSADRLQQSSTQFVHEFVEKARHAVSTSEGQKEEKIHDTQLVQENEEDKQKSVGQVGLGDSRRSSRGSGAKGPSDEMWHVADQSIQGPSKVEVAPESTVSTSESGVVKRTGRSIWNVIGDIVRMRWASSRPETHTSKSGGKSSPNQSTGSEAWFSGHEADENNDENVRGENTILPQETSSSDKQPSGGIRSETQELSSPISLRNNIKHAGVDSSSFSSTESGSALKGRSLPSLQGTSSGTGIVETSLPLPLPAIRMRRSPAVKNIPEASKTDASGSGKMEIEQAIPGRLPEVSGTEAKDGELKRRKFQRSDHVLKDRFDEWEEAHTLETEQRKTDEMFMREALLEARKGADMWEVPVGAVLVQHGKIIARGYNLVEDLRDSTAHAEMICIREASNVLRTWRLSETTLYVTLEPCPMCAGAILQARVDTVVWGAPNKLLGADGSWIRLFPNGSGGNDLELGDKATAGPVHPFHPNITIRRGILSSECADVMQQFFQLRRKKKTEQPPTPPACLPVSTHPSKLLSKMHEAFHMMFCL